MQAASLGRAARWRSLRWPRALLDSPDAPMVSPVLVADSTVQPWPEPSSRLPDEIGGTTLPRQGGGGNGSGGGSDEVPPGPDPIHRTRPPTEAALGGPLV